MTGYLLVGGQGRRLGGAKATRLFGGRPLWSYGYDLLREGCEEVVLLGRCPEIDKPALIEPESGQGPLGALLCALENCSQEGCLVLALDYPLLTREILAQLRPTDAEWQARLARCAGRQHPLCGYYHPCALPALRKAYAEGERSVLRALRGVSVEWVDFVEERSFLNVNRPEDLGESP